MTYAVATHARQCLRHHVMGGTMLKILIMDDETALRNIVYNILKPLGHMLLAVDNGRTAVETARAQVPDIALLDMRVPDKDGLEVLTELLEINPRMRCIMISGFGDESAARAALARGAVEYITKPFKIDDVLHSVTRAAAGDPAPARDTPSLPLPPPPSVPVADIVSSRGYTGAVVAGAFMLLCGIWVYAVLRL